MKYLKLITANILFLCFLSSCGKKSSNDVKSNSSDTIVNSQKTTRQKNPGEFGMARMATSNKCIEHLIFTKKYPDQVANHVWKVNLDIEGVSYYNDYYKLAPATHYQVRNTVSQGNGDNTNQYELDLGLFRVSDDVTPLFEDYHSIILKENDVMSKLTKVTVKPGRVPPPLSFDNFVNSKLVNTNFENMVINKIQLDKNSTQCYNYNLILKVNANSKFRNYTLKNVHFGNDSFKVLVLRRDNVMAQNDKDSLNVSLTGLDKYCGFIIMYYDYNLPENAIDFNQNLYYKHFAIRFY